MTKTIALLDLLALLVETPQVPAHVAALMIFRLPAKARRDTVAEIVTAWRRAKPVPPFTYIAEFPRLGLPRWKVANEIDLRYHVRHMTLPAPGTMDQLRELVEVLHTERLDRERPLFQVLVIDGLEGGRFAIYARIHHAIIDGMSAIVRVIASLSEAPGRKLLPPIHALDLDAAREAPPRLLSERLASFGIGVLRQASAATEVYRRVFAESAAAFTTGHGNAANLFSAPHIVTNDPFGIERSVAMFSVPLDALRSVAKAFGGTLNDVVMAIVDEALVRYLARRGEMPDERLVAGCPVSTREKGDTRAGTDATMIFVPLGDPDAAPGERLAQIVANTRAAKANVRSLSKDAARDYALLALGLSEGIGAAGLRARVAPLVNLAVSNVPGPRVPLYLGPARLESLFPISMLASGVGLNVTLVSTAEEMHFGVIAGAALMPDVQKLERLCVQALAALEQEAIRGPGAGTTKRAGRISRARRSSRGASSRAR